jgi:hypothetical protein
MKITRYALVVVSLLMMGVLLNAGCSKGGQWDATDLDGGAPSTGTPGTSPGGGGGDESVAFTIKEVTLVLPNQDEVGLDSKRISRYSSIKVAYVGDLPSDIGLKMGGNSVEYAVLSDVDGELLIKPAMPMHNLKTYELGDFSFTIKAPGDINGDGYSDFVAGAPLKSNFGAAYVFFGTDPLEYGLSVTNAAGATISGNVANAEFGGAVAIGDINGDGYADIAVGAPKENQGCVYVFHGSDALHDMLADGAQNTRICRTNGLSTLFGSAVAVGDLNGDGLDDLVVGESKSMRVSNTAPIYLQSGAVEIFWGNKNGIANRSVSDTETADVSYSSPTNYQRVGYSLATGDLNGDGIDDAVIGALGSDKVPAPVCRQGKVYIALGAKDLGEQTASMNLDDSSVATTLTGQGCISDETDRFGVSVAAADGEGKDKALIGSKSNSYEYSIGSPMDFLLLSLPPNDVIVGWLGDAIGLGLSSSDMLRYKKPESSWQSVQGTAGSAYGCAISPAGDLDRNGKPDFVVGARMYSNNRGKIVVNIDDETIVGVTGSELGTALAGGRIR